MSSNLAKRTLTCVVGVPAILAIIFLVPQYNFIALSIFIILMCLLGSIEMSRMLFGHTVPSAFLSTGFCILTYVRNLLDIKAYIAFYFFLLSIIAILSAEIKKGEKTDFASSITDISKKMLLLLYPGYLLSFIILMLSLENISASAVVLFICLVFSNDIFAYIFGMLFGRGHGGVVKVSPKKSLAGFAGGLVGCIGICLLLFALLKDLPSIALWIRILLAVLISTAANIGDLAESVFKRSAGVKDSGNIFPGRGGVLDSIDSIIVSAPFFYIVWNLI